jgi:hypothetical protein
MQPPAASPPGRGFQAVRRIFAEHAEVIELLSKPVSTSELASTASFTDFMNRLAASLRLL